MIDGGVHHPLEMVHSSPCEENLAWRRLFQSSVGLMCGDGVDLTQTPFSTTSTTTVQPIVVECGSDISRSIESFWLMIDDSRNILPGKLMQISLDIFLDKVLAVAV